MTGVASTFLPVQDVDFNHSYGHPCSEPFLLASSGLFVPAMVLALIAAARLHTALRAEQAALPRAALAGTGMRARLRGRLAELDARLVAMGRIPRSGRICAWIALPVGAGLLLPEMLDGPGRLPGALGHLLIFALVVVAAPRRRASGDGR